MGSDARRSAFRWADRYDAVGIAVGVVLFGVLVAAGLSIWAALAIGAALVTTSSYALRRRAGVPQETLWERARQRRRPQR